MGTPEEDALQNHDEALLRVLKRARLCNLKLNKQKLQLRLPELSYIGHRISASGVRPDPVKVVAINKIPAPTSVPEVRRFLGMCNYLSRFILKLSQVSEPLRALTESNKNFVWGKAEQEHFEQMKALISEDQLLRFYDVKKPTTIQFDASITSPASPNGGPPHHLPCFPQWWTSTSPPPPSPDGGPPHHLPPFPQWWTSTSPPPKGLGTTLLQEGHPIISVSRSLTKAEKNYVALELECLAIVFACQKFHHYIYGKHTFVETDDKPLEVIAKKSILAAPRRLQRMLLQLQWYDLEITYRPGKQQWIADILSRLPVESPIRDKFGRQEIFHIIHGDWNHKSSALWMKQTMFM